MLLFLDSAKLDEILQARDLWNLDGLTTNPRHIRESGKPFHVVIEQIAEVFAGSEMPVSVEVDPHLDDWRQIVRQGQELARISPNFVIKVAVSEVGCKAIHALHAEGIRTNATLIFTTTQAWHAARAGADYVSPFIGWKETHGDDTSQLLAEVRQMLDNFGYQAQIIAAAIRSSRQMAVAALAGADCLTASLSVYQESFRNPYTDMGNQLFGAAWNATPQ